MLNLEELHEKYYGAQDAYDVETVKKLVGVKHDGIVKETRTFTFDCSEEKNAKFYYSHILSEPISKQKSYEGEAYTNFKITPSSAITDIYIEIGGQRIERPVLYSLLNKDVEFYEMSNGRALPALQAHTNKIEFKTNCIGQVTISYDVVTQTNPDTVIETVLYSEQFTGCELISIRPGGKDKIKLNYNHPIVTIYAFLPETTVDARILLDGVDHNLVLTKKEDYYIFEFGDKTSVNFSRIDNPFLHITQADREEFDKLKGTVKHRQLFWSTNTDTSQYDCHVVGVYKNVLRRMNGMAGLAFSK